MYNNINDNDNNNNNVVLLWLKRFIEISKKFLKTDEYGDDICVFSTLYI